MGKPTRTAFAIATLSVLLLVGCGTAPTPSAVAVVPTDTPVPTPTATPALTPTATPTLTQTPSPTAPPTATSVPTSAPAPPYAVHGPYAAGARDFEIEDGDHSVGITVWYPALNPDNAREEITYHVSEKVPRSGLTVSRADLPIKGRAIQNAVPDTVHGPYPLVIFSTGLAGFRQSSAYLLEHLATYGFVVMAADPRGETNSSCWAGAATRPIDTKLTISFADKATAAGGTLEQLIDMEHIAVVGHSSGGWTALVGGGAQFDFGWCGAHPDFGNCPQFVPHAEEIAALLGLQAVPSGLWPPMYDRRVGAVIALAPDGDIWGAEYEGVAVMKVPTVVMVGTEDTVSPPDQAAYPIYQHLGSAQKGLIKFENADHFVFVIACRDASWLPTLACSQVEWDMDRAHDLINHFATAFLLTELRGDQEAAKALLPENVSFAGIEYETSGFSAAK